IHNERSRKYDRYHSNIFSMIRTATIRSKSLETNYDHHHRRQGNIIIQNIT
ncbi:unnamed protein product, partial [Rotaria sordida]